MVVMYSVTSSTVFNRPTSFSRQGRRHRYELKKVVSPLIKIPLTCSSRRISLVEWGYPLLYREQFYEIYKVDPPKTLFYFPFSGVDDPVRMFCVRQFRIFVVVETDTLWILIIRLVGSRTTSSNKTIVFCLTLVTEVRHSPISR